MNERADPDQPGREDLCPWCGHELTRDERERWGARICARCYRLLSDAGIRDEEIFREPPPEEE